MAKLKYLLILMILFFSACSTTKYLAPGQKLYNGAQIKITDKNTSKSEADAIGDELQGLLRPLPNAKILGLRFKLWVYDKTRTTKQKAN